MMRFAQRLQQCALIVGLIMNVVMVGSANASDCVDAQCELSTVTDAEILANPSPSVTLLATNEEAVSDRRYTRVHGAVEIHAAPGGEVTGVLDAGFNFLTTQGGEGEWTMINPDQWVRTEALSNAYPSTFAGVLLPETTLPYTAAWVLVNTTPSRSPGAEPLDADIELTRLRYQIVNLFNMVEIDGWQWFQIGVDQWIEQRNLARILPIERPADVDTERWVSVDLYEQVLIAYEGTTPVFATLVASGLEEWPTNEGLFHVYVRYPRTIMSGAEGQPDFYYLEEVPWTMYFDNDIGLHGTYWHDGFGYRHSHGCVNLSITDSHWLYHWAAPEVDLTVPGDLGAAVYVYSSGVYQ